MKCYSLEELLAFAMNPEKPEQEEIAVHVIKCGKCRKDFELVLETLGNEVQAPLPGDKALAEAATKELFARQKWNSFSNFIERISSTLQEQAKKGLSFLNTAQLFAPQKKVFAASSGTGSAPAQLSFNDAPSITFEADTPDYSDYYWKIQMVFPMMISDSAMIQMKVSGKSEKNINQGTLLFLGKEYRIMFGNVSIPFREFKNNSACTSSIGIRFDDGSATSGSIKFLPESFL